MNKLKFIVLLLCIAVISQLFSQQINKDNNKPGKKMEDLTTVQKEQVKIILSNYDPDSLTAEDAKAIHEAFCDAGLRGGPLIDDIIREVGFDPEKLRDLAPPPNINEIKNNDKNKNANYNNNLIQNKNGFFVTSSAINKDGSLLSYYTGDDKGVSFPLKWTNIPEGTKYLALSLWHLPNPSDRTEIKSYWVIYNIPADICSLPENVQEIGENGYNDKNTTGYDPMRSRGPGVKEYNLTIYALSEKVVCNNPKVTRTDLLKAIKGITINECTLKYTYERKMINEKK